MGLQTLRQAREQAGISQMQLAQVTGISQATLSHVEQGVKPLKLIDMLRLEHVLQRKLDWGPSLQTLERDTLKASLNTLLDNYPPVQVMKFAVEVLSDPGNTAPWEDLAFFAEAANRYPAESLAHPRQIDAEQQRRLEQRRNR